MMEGERVHGKAIRSALRATGGVPLIQGVAEPIDLDQAEVRRG